MATEARETGNLIGSDKVEGTPVFGADRADVARAQSVNDYYGIPYVA
jgi:hypothetical protein